MLVREIALKRYSLFTEGVKCPFNLLHHDHSLLFPLFYVEILWRKLRERLPCVTRQPGCCGMVADLRHEQRARRSGTRRQILSPRRGYRDG